MAAPACRSARLGALGALAAALLLGCGEPPVSWNEAHVATTVGDALSPDGGLISDSSATLAARVATPDRAACSGSLTLARAGRRLFAVWWRARPDSSALLLAARSDDDGATWSSAASVDTTDRSVSGCRRAPPSLAADSASGYVHVVFSLLGAEGPGVFYAHSMDAGATFHAAVPIFYGERLGRSSVRANGDVVAVAFEDPNGRRPSIGLALSRTMGHIFEERLLPISDDNETATQPLVAVQGRRLAVSWLRGDPTDAVPDVRVVRTGTLR